MVASHIPLILTLDETNLLVNTFWAIVDSVATLIIGYFSYKKAKEYRKNKSSEKDLLIETQQDEIAKRDANDAVKVQLESLEHKFDAKFSNIEAVLAKINYAIFNSGKTGLVNKVDFMLENQNEMAIAIEVLKAKSEK